jgi:putative hydrolase of the HAD superfamily
MIRTLFVDIGGVLLTNAWDSKTRKLAADKFDLDIHEMNERHHLTFDTYEEGKLTLDEYLKRVVFIKSAPSRERNLKISCSPNLSHSPK